MHAITEWVKDHPYLTAALGLGAIVLFLILRSAASNSSTAQQAATVSSGPDDSIQAQELQTGAALQQAQLAAQVQVAGINATTSTTNYQTQVAGTVSNEQTQAALTLGLAGPGQSTASVLQLLSAQPGANIGQFMMIPGYNSISTPVVPSQPVTIGVGSGGGTTVGTTNPGAGGAASGGAGQPAAQGFFSTDPTQCGGSCGYNEAANALTAAAYEQDAEHEVPPVQSTQYFANGYTAPGLSCGNGYILENGQCVDAAYSMGAAADEEQIQIDASEHLAPVDALPGGGCPSGYNAVNNTCYAAGVGGQPITAASSLYGPVPVSIAS